MSEFLWKEEESFETKSLDDIPDGFRPLDKSIYEGVVTEAVLAPTKEGRPAIQLTVRADRDLVIDESVEALIKFEKILITKEKAGFKAKQLSASSGVSFPESQKPEVVRAYCDELVGKTVFFRTNHSQNKDKTKTYAGIERYFAPEQVDEAVSAAKQALAS